ncbi:MAG: hypothetical protein V4474_02005 [Patescibacteria group bacterium]
MSKLLHNTKLIGALVVILVLCGVAYFYWGSSAPASPVAVAPTEPVASQELLTTLGSLRSIQLDPSIFSDPLFVSLSDFGVTIPPEPSGRRNPFAPVGAQ